MSETLRPDSGSPRGTARVVRSGCLCVATVTGVVCLVAKWGVPGLFVCSVLGAMSAAVVASAIWSDDDDGWNAVRKIAKLALVASLLVPGAIGLIAALEFTGVLIVLILAGTTPAITSRVRARWFPAAHRPPPQRDKPVGTVSTARPRPAAIEPAAEPMPELDFLDDQALCLAWRRSFVRLESARSAAERLAVVEQRQKYLDELHRRSPDGLAAWFASGARASGNPLPYVDEDRRRID